MCNEICRLLLLVGISYRFSYGKFMFDVGGL